jgi:hypothetical protein
MGSPKEVFLVVQQGGSSREMYLHAFDTLEQADKYRADAYENGAYQTSEVFEVPVGIETYMEEIQDIIAAAVEMV